MNSRVIHAYAPVWEEEFVIHRRIEQRYHDTRHTRSCIIDKVLTGLILVETEF